MSLLDAITRAQQLTETLMSEQPESELIKALQAEITTIDQHVKASLKQTDKTPSGPLLTRDEKSGCYMSGEGTGFYCPKCYEKNHHLSTTQRINSRLRVCPTCRASIKSA